MRPAARTRWDALAPGQTLPERAFTPGSAELFLYSAIIWNAHRIHYDSDYAMNSEGHVGLLIAGPLQGDWLCQSVTDWLGAEGTLERFAFSHRRPAHLGETFTAAGRILAMDATTGRITLELALRNGRAEVVTPGEAVVRFA